MTGSRVYLIGAGGHARCVVEALEASCTVLAAYSANEPANWLDVPLCQESQIPDGASVVFGIGGVTPARLEARYALARQDWLLPPVIHGAAIVSSTARIQEGVHVFAGAVIQANARIGRLAIVNSRAVVDHDAEVDEGAHIAPGAIVLGGARVGKFAMIGAGAVVLPFTRVPERTLVKALHIWRDAPAENET